VRNIFIFPFGNEITPALFHDFFTKYNSVYILEEHKEAPKIDGVQFITTDLWSEIITQCDEALIVSDEKVPLSLYKRVIEQLLKANVIVFLSRTIADQLNIEAQDNIKIIGKNLLSSKVSVKQLVPINVPVIGILGDGKLTDKFQIQIALDKSFKRLGYNVLSITAKEYADFLGMSLIPNFIFEPMYLSDKIVALNQYFYNIIFHLKPDLVLLNIPGGALPISEQYVKEFGEFAYTLCNALSPDILIRTLYFNNYDSPFFENDIRQIKYRYNVAPEYYCISSTSLVYPPSLMDELGYLKVEPMVKQQVIKNIRSLDLPCDIFEYDNTSDVDHICDKMIQSLAGDFSIV